MPRLVQVAKLDGREDDEQFSDAIDHELSDEEQFESPCGSPVSHPPHPASLLETSLPSTCEQSLRDSNVLTQDKDLCSMESSTQGSLQGFVSSAEFPVEALTEEEGNTEETSRQASLATQAQTEGHAHIVESPREARLASDLEAGLEESTPAPSELPEDAAERLQKSEEHKQAGNALYKQKDYDGAIREYNQALEVAPETSQERAVYYANSAAVYLAQEQHHDCVECCTAALAVDATYQKALLRRMVAYEALDDLDHGLRDAQKILELDPGHMGARANVAKWEPVVKERQEKMKEEMFDKLKDLGNSVLGRFGMSVDNFKFEQDPTSGSYSVKFQQ